MSWTTIKTNFSKTLKQGDENELRLISMLSLIYEDVSKYLPGENSKDGDIYIKDINCLLEVKYDILSKTTGNFALEFMFRWAKSGILTTKSQYIVFSDDFNHYILRVKDLLDWLSDNKGVYKKVSGGDDNESMMLLVPRKDLIGRSFCFNLNNETIYQLKSFLCG